VSVDIADIGEGLSTGSKRIEPDGREYVLLLSGAGDIANGNCITLDVVETTATVMHVQQATVTESAIAINNTGVLIPDGSYFWGITHGIGYVTFSAAESIGDALETANSGEVQSIALITEHRLGYALETGGAAANHAVYIVIS